MIHRPGPHFDFLFFPDTDQEMRVHNNLLDEGEEAFLKMIAQDAQGDIAAGGDWYVGLCGADFDETTTLTTLVGEPDGTGGYAREALVRDNVGWPTVSEVNGIWRAQSAIVTFSASGGNFSEAISRAFLCNVASGTSGKLFSVSGALPEAVQIDDGSSFPMRFELYLR